MRWLLTAPVIMVGFGCLNLSLSFVTGASTGEMSWFSIKLKPSVFFALVGLLVIVTQYFLISPPRDGE